MELPVSFRNELSIACELARRAGAVIMEHYASEVQVDYKDVHESDPVTAADRDANHLIVEGLRAAFPGDGILAEESDDHSSRLQRQRLWCVDPLDGTREFVERNGQFVVMIGLAIDGRAAAGVVYQPTEDLLWWGADGVAAEVRAGGGERRLQISDTSDPAQATLMVSRSHRSKTVTAAAQRAGISREMPLGSVGLKVARIATAAADAYISATNKTKEWDACAPDAILHAAGGRMTDILGNPLQYNKERVDTPHGMLASNGALHDICVAALRPVVEERGWG